MISKEALEQIDNIKEKCQRIKPKVAIRCITFNQEKYIRDALESFVAQKTDFPFVAIIHDDASTDKTQEIIQEYSNRYPDIILPILQKENQYSKGQGSFAPITKTMNEAVEASEAEYAAPCEGDDYWIDPLKLQKQVDFLEANPDYGMVYGKSQGYDQVNKKVIKILGKPYKNFKELVTTSFEVPTATVLYRTDTYNRAYREYLENKKWMMGDLPLSLSLATKSKIKFLDEELGVYRILSDSACHFKKLDDQIKFLNSALDVRKYFLEKNNLNKYLPEVEQNHLLELYKKGLIYKDYKYSYQISKKLDKKKVNSTLLKYFSFSYPIFIAYINAFKTINKFRSKQ